MKISVEIKGQKFCSIDKPKMKHLRMGGRILQLQNMAVDERKKMYRYLGEIYEYIRDTFPKIEDEDIDCMATEDFLQLVSDIAAWANGVQADEQKKN